MSPFAPLPVFLRSWLFFALVGLAAVFPQKLWAHPLRVTFLNPGLVHESFWSDVDRFMEAAASKLSIQLTILHGQRDSARIMALGRQIAQAKPSPDFVVLVNEKGTGPELLKLLAPTHAKILFILNGFSPAQKKMLGEPRGKYPNWLGTLLPDNHWVGYQTTRVLYQRLRKLKPNQAVYHMFAISGDRVTPASVKREQGMRDFVKTHPRLHLDQVVYGHWVEDRAHDQAALLLRRYPRTDAIWTANDHMAFGAIKALEADGRRPGKDVLLSSVNSSPKVLGMTDQGVITALGAGHFTAGGWALVLLYDYAHGHDFVDQGTVIRRPLFELVPAHSALLNLLRQHAWGQVNYLAFSRTRHPDSRYQFHLLSP